MLIKQFDDHSHELAQLELLAKSGPGDIAKRAAKDLAIRKAGIKGETESAYLLDFHFADSPNWALIHDLRLDHNGRVAQIDHLLINRWMECYVLETKHFNAGIKITEDGEFLRWNDYKHNFEGMSSPLLQNERHIAVLRDAMDELDLPTRLGIRIKFSFQSFVMVAPSARIDRPKKFDTSRVIKADQIRERILRDIDRENALLGIMKTAAKIVSGDTVHGVAQQLANMHRATPWPMPAPMPTHRHAVGEEPAPTAAFAAGKADANPSRKSPSSAAVTSTAATGKDGPECKQCQSHDGAILCGKYGYYFQCAACQTNTAIKFTCAPGHKPRLRKAGKQFFRDCAECGSSELYFSAA